MRAAFTRTLIISLSLLSSQATWATSFQTQIAIDNADNPLSITSADFNTDGNADLAVTSYSTDKSTNEIKVLLGAGDATFDTATAYTTGTAPSSITSAELNGGSIDLAVANSDNNSISIFINKNDGSGTFFPEANYTTGTTPAYILAAELNGADVDLITANSGNNTISVFINNSDGTFATKTDYSTGQAPNAIAAADFNSDGDIDLVVTNQTDNTVSVFINNGAGVFAAKVDYPTGTTPISIASKDISGDTYPDLVISNSGDDTISVLMNNGASGPGTFTSKIDYATGTAPKSVSISDLDKDGDLDIAVSNNFSDSISVFSNNNGSLSAKTDFTTPKGPSAIFAQDIDNDTYADLITTNLSSHNFSYLKNLTAVTPDSFIFTAQTDVALSTKITSNEIELDGLLSSTTLSISGKEISNPDSTTTFSAEYSTDGGSTFTSSPSTVSDGTKVRVRLLSSATNNTTETATITIGGFSTTFSVTTAASNTAPVNISFSPVVNAEPGTVITSESVTVSGIASNSSIAITLGEYSINGADFTSNPGAINNNDELKIRLTSLTTYGVHATALISINVGEITATFDVFTKDDPSSSNSSGGSSSLSIWISLFMSNALLLRYSGKLRRQHRLSHAPA